MSLEIGQSYPMVGGVGFGVAAEKCRFSDDVFVRIELATHPLNGKQHRYWKDGRYKGPYVDRARDPYRCPDLVVAEPELVEEETDFEVAEVEEKELTVD